VCIFELDAKSGSVVSELINTGAQFRTYLCLEFSKNNEDYLFAGTASGEVCAFSMKLKVLSLIVTVSAKGIQSLCAISAQLLIVGCGDGTLANCTLIDSQLVVKNKAKLQGSIISISTYADCKEAICATNTGTLLD